MTLTKIKTWTINLAREAGTAHPMIVPPSSSLSKAVSLSSKLRVLSRAGLARRQRDG